MNYFDHAASTPLYPEVANSLIFSLQQDFANPGAIHLLGQELAEKISQYRVNFLKALDASNNDHFIFTSSATESNNTVIRGLRFLEGDVAVYCSADHPSVTVPVEHLKGVSLKKIVLEKDGSVDLDLFKNMIDDRVRLVVLTSVNNQSGVINDIDLLAKIVKSQSNAHVHVDAVQSYGKVEFKLSSQIDSASFSSHKIGGPKGIAGLYLKQGHVVEPLLLGGGQEQGLRSSTESYSLISCFHEVMKLVSINEKYSLERTYKYSEMIKKHLQKLIPSLIMPFENTSPYIVSFILPGISSDIILRHLEMNDVYISSTSACSSKQKGFNPTLFAMNIPEKFHKNFLRISLGPKTTLGEVENLLEVFEKVWESIKHMQQR